jgi:hypothetical protein
LRWALMLVGKLLQETLAPGVSWSPYYKVATEEVDVQGSNCSHRVNGVPHQLMAPCEVEAGAGRRNLRDALSSAARKSPR